MRRFRLVAVFAVASLALAAALPAGAGTDIEVSIHEGPPGTVVTITQAARGVTQPCNEPIALKAIPTGEENGADQTGGQPFTPPDGTWTVPSLLVGLYNVNVVCGGAWAMDTFWFRVTPTTITAEPNFTG